jgi:hypothetical protein
MADDSIEELREELKEIDDGLATLRATVEDMRKQIADRSYGSGDRLDTTTLITEAEEEEAVVATLEARRAEILTQLGET